jgi:hypothetical protein
MLSKIDKMKFLINDFQALRSSKRTIRLNRIAAFLSTFEENHRKLRNQRLADFNVFSLLRIGEDEVRQSKFLAWLLDAESGHGQGNLFLQAFVKSCHLNIPLEVLDQYRVRTEYYRNESRIDVLAYRKGEFLIYLENKICAPEGPNQIDREFRDMRSVGSALRIPEERQFAVFLTPDAKKQPTSGDATRWLSVSYNQIGAEFKKLLPGITSDKVKFILKDWMDTISLWRYL